MSQQKDRDNHSHWLQSGGSLASFPPCLCSGNIPRVDTMVEIIMVLGSEL